MNAPDWEAIESAYRAGSLSVRAIADVHTLTEGAVRKRAKKEGWTRDLTEKVKLATKEKLVRTDGTQYARRTDHEIVEDASAVAAAVVLSHRAGLARWRKIADKLCDALDLLDVDGENIGDFSRALNAGVDAQLKVIKGERQAFNLDADDVPGEGIATITRVERVIIDAAKN